MTTVIPQPMGIAPVGEDRVAAVYRHAITRGRLASVDDAAAELGLALADAWDAVAHLVERRLLTTDGTGGAFVPVAPDVATASLVSSVEREMYQRRALIDQLMERVGAAPPGDGGGPGRDHGAIEHLVGPLEVRGFLKVSGDACRNEVLVLQHGVDGVDEMAQTCLSLLERGVTVRIVCRHRDRVEMSSRLRMRRLVDAGACVRTVSHVPRAAVVFDRSLAVLFGSPDGEVTASRVRNPGVVQFLLDLFDHLWDAAAPLDSVDSGYAEVTDDLRQSLAALMARGYTDEVVARKLGMSVRTCRRHIAALMRDLDAISRFQAGVEAARRSVVGGV